MKYLLVFFLTAILLSGCTAPTSTTSTETEKPVLAADTTDQYYDPDYKMPPKTKWVLNRINGQEMAVAKIRGEVPTMEINLPEGKVRGTGGCNRYNTSVEIEGESIKFGHILSTKVNCPSIDLERRFFGILNFGMLDYQWSPGKLIIQRDVRSVLEFKEVPAKK